METQDQYNKICKPRLDDIISDLKEQKKETNENIKEIKEQVNKIHDHIFNNGLQKTVQKNSIIIGFITTLITVIFTVLAWKFIPFILNL